MGPPVGIDPLWVVYGITLEELHANVAAGNLPEKEVLSAQKAQPGPLPRGPGSHPPRSDPLGADAPPSGPDSGGPGGGVIQQPNSGPKEREDGVRVGKRADSAPSPSLK